MIERDYAKFKNRLEYANMCMEKAEISATYANELIEWKDRHNIKNYSFKIIGIYFALHKADRDIKRCVKAVSEVARLKEFYSCSNNYLTSEQESELFFDLDKLNKAKLNFPTINFNKKIAVETAV